MQKYVLELEEIDQTQVATAGGKGARLGGLTRIAEVRVPPGFCVTTRAFQRFLEGAPWLDAELERVTRLKPDDTSAIRALSAALRERLEASPVPADVHAAVAGALSAHGEDAAYAVRSSATAEDSATASFAGQHDTFLNVTGLEAVLHHVRRSWASVFTERAVSYRLRAGAAHRAAQMAVVVQRMVAPDAAGVLFTADPVTSNRDVCCVEASFGLGEALVSGLVDPDVFRVRDGQVVERTIAAKRLAIRAAAGGGVSEQTVAAERQEQAALTDAQAVRLALLGRRVEAYFGQPQDIEWCLADGELTLVQSRPITTLFPIPDAGDVDRHVYISVGHQQMMTDPMKPLGLSLFQLTALPRMYDAAGRLFVDVAPRLASPRTGPAIVATLGKSDPLIGGALQTVLDRGFVPVVADAETAAAPPPAPEPIATDPALVAKLIARTEASLAVLEREIEGRTGPDLVDFVIGDVAELKRVLFDPEGIPVIMAALDATAWLNGHMEEWLGEPSAADTLTQSAPGNITSEMGLALLDVADVIRPFPAVVAFLERVEDDDFLDELATLEGGAEARDSIEDYLGRYGMRCVGEIDITRPRWRERPALLLPLLLGNVRSFEPGASRRRFEQGAREAAAKEEELLARLRALPDGGEEKAAETKRVIDRVRTFIGFREYPKYGKICRYFIYKRALMAEAARLVAAGVLRDSEDIFFLTLSELAEVTRAQVVDTQLLARRREAFDSYGALTPPRVMTSEGEVLTGSYTRADAPDGALLGLAVSSGTVEGRARVILDMTDADLEAGDILVTAYTDPSWSPLFVAAAALVTEVGGLMTHGAVVAREYGLPAVVGVEQATKQIRDGQRIRVHGTAGYVEILGSAES